jgi:hypothetical protein
LAAIVAKIKAIKKAIIVKNPPIIAQTETNIIPIITDKIAIKLFDTTSFFGLYSKNNCLRKGYIWLSVHYSNNFS